MKPSEFDCKTWQEYFQKTQPQALDAFVAEIGEAKAKLDQIGAFVDDHCETAPDEVTWGDVGGMNEMNETLSRITQQIEEWQNFNRNRKS